MSDTANLPSKKRAFTYCATTREYLGELEVYLSPLDGVYPLPNNVVLAEPSANPGPLKTRRLAQDSGAWEVVDDFRYIMLWDTATTLPVANTLALGEVPPPYLTHAAPPIYEPHECKCVAWDASINAWVTAPDYSRCPLWVKATGEHAPLLPPGVELPITLTIVPPPIGEQMNVSWNEVIGVWESTVMPAPLSGE